MATDNVADAWIEAHLDDRLLPAEVKAAADRASRAAKVRVEVEVDRDSVTRALTSLSRTTTSTLGGITKLTTGIAATTFALGTLASVTSGTVASLGGLAAGVTAVTGALVAAAPAAVALGGAFAALGVGAAAAIVGFQGMGEAAKLQAKAQQELAETGEVSEATQKKLTAAMENLAPAARQVLRTFEDLRPALENVRRTTQQRLFEGVSDDIKSIVTTLMPAFQTSLGLAADRINDLVVRFDDFVTARENTQRINDVMSSLNRQFANLTQAVVPFGNALLNIFDAASPLALRFSRAIENTAVSMSGFFETANESGELQAFFGRAGDLAATLGSILFNLGDILGSIFGAGIDEGQGLLEVFDRATQRFADFLDTAEGTDALNSFFGLMGALADQAARLGEIFGPLFSGVGTALEAILPAIAALSAAFTPILVLLSETLGGALAELGPVIAGIVTALTPLATEVAGVLVDLFTGITPVLTQVAKALTPVVSLLGGVLAQALATLAPLFVQLVESLAPLVTSIAPIFVQLLQAILPALVEIFAAVSPLIVAIGAGLVPVIQALVDAFVPLIPFIVQFVSTIVEALVPAMPALSDALVNVATILGIVLEALAPILPDLATLVALAIEAVTPLLEIGAAMTEMFIQTGILEGALTIIVGVLKVVIGIIGGVIAVLGGLLDAVSGLVSGAVGKFTEFVDFVKGLPDKVSEGLDNLVQGFQDHWDDILLSTAVFIGKVGAFFLELPGRILGYLAGLADDIVDAIVPDGGIDLTPGFDIPGVPGLALGGVLTSPSLRVAGEAGPEAYVPLTPGAAWAPGLESVVAQALANRGVSEPRGDFIYSPQFFGPTTSGDRLQELEWIFNYGTERLPEAVRTDV